MTAIRSFPNAPLAQRSRLPLVAQLSVWADFAWQALQRAGQRRAAWELELLAERRASSDPALAQQLRRSAEESRRAAAYVPHQHQGSRS